MFLVSKKTIQPRKQVAARIVFKCNIQIRERKCKPDRLAFELRDDHEAWDNDGLQILCKSVEFFVRHRNCSPIMLPRSIIEILHQGYFPGEFAHIQRTKGKTFTLADNLSCTWKFSRSYPLARYLVSEQVFRLLEPRILDQRGVVWWIVRHENGGRLIETIDQ